MYHKRRKLCKLQSFQNPPNIFCCWKSPRKMYRSISKMWTLWYVYLMKKVSDNCSSHCVCFHRSHYTWLHHMPLFTITKCPFCRTKICIPSCLSQDFQKENECPWFSLSELLPWGKQVKGWGTVTGSSAGGGRSSWLWLLEEPSPCSHGTQSKESQASWIFCLPEKEHVVHHQANLLLDLKIAGYSELGDLLGLLMLGVIKQIWYCFDVPSFFCLWEKRVQSLQN